MRSLLQLTLAITCTALVLAHARADDAGVRDAGVRDTAVRDAGVRDAGIAIAPVAPVELAPDAAVQRSPTADASATTDGGASRARQDAGEAATEPRVTHTRVVDAGPPDTGVLDAGVLDAAVVDAAISTDAGVAPDASPDAGALASAEEITPQTPADSSGAVIRTLLGLVVLLTLAYLGGHPRVQRIEERLGISQVMTSGLPYVLLGLLARHPALDVLNDETMRSILPLLTFGLGWIGFQTGFSFEASALDRVARGTGTVVILLTTFPFIAIALTSALVLRAVGLGSDPLALARDACLLGLAGALSAPTVERVIGQQMSSGALELARAIGHLDDVVGVIALTCLAAFLHARAPGTDWQLPGVGWVFVTFGMAVAVGIVVYAVLRGTDGTAEKVSLLLGSVALTAGLAGYLSLSPLVICFLAGVLLRNLPGDDKAQLESSFRRLERPVYLLFLVIVGGLWRIDDWRGWLLLPVFVLARFAGRYLGARASRALPEREQPPALAETDDRDLVTPPMGQLALAFVVTAQTLYESPAVQAVVTAVIGGAVLLEVVVQVSARRAREPAPTPTPEDALAQQDRLDEHVVTSQPEGAESASDATTDDAKTDDATTDDTMSEATRPDDDEEER